MPAGIPPAEIWRHWRKPWGRMHKLGSLFVRDLAALVGAIAFAALALDRGESINSVWLVTEALCACFIVEQIRELVQARAVLALQEGSE
jgi:hypothetical protein